MCIPLFCSRVPRHSSSGDFTAPSADKPASNRKKKSLRGLRKLFSVFKNSFCPYMSEKVEPKLSLDSGCW